MTEIPDGFQLENRQSQAEIPEGFEPEGPSIIDRANQGINLGLTFFQGRTFGVGPKIMSAIGAVPAKAVLEGGEMVNNLAGGDYQAPSYADLYKIGVEGYQGKVKQSYEDHPYMSPVAEIAGGIRTGVQIGKTKLGQGIDNWRNAATLSDKAKSAGPLTQKALRLLEKSGRGGLLGEAGYRTYKVGTASPGEEADALTTGAPIGFGMGMAAPGISAAISSAGRAITPKIDEALRPVVDLAKKYNIPVSVDQITSSKPIKTAQKISQELPFSTHGAFRDKQMAAFNRALTKTFGQDAPAITPEVMKKAFADVGKEFDNLGKGKTFVVGQNFKQSIDDILTDSSAYTDDAIRAFKKEAEVVVNNAEGGSISGERLAHLRTRLNALARKTNDSDKQVLFKDLENAVIDIMTEGDDLAKGALSEAKRKYKNLLVVEPLAQKAKGGTISPSQLSTRAAKIYGRAYTTGQAGEIGELARIGKELLPELGGSDTTQKAMFLGGAAGGVWNAPGTTATVLGTNAAMQKWVNQNPKLVEKLIMDEFQKQLTGPAVPAIGLTTGVLTE